MTPILTHLVALIIGFLIATLILWTANRKQRQDWQAEYRRLMGGIKSARDGLGAWIERRTGLKDQKDPISIKKDLDKLFYNEPTWPRE